jgi:LysR family nitrogen assimilation transcriptional regulator
VDSDNRISLKQLAGLPLALPSMDHGLRRLIETHAQQAGVPLNVDVELDAGELLLEIVASTDLFTIYSRAALQGRGFQNLLHPVRIVNPCIERKILLAHMSGRPLTRVARSVDKYVRQILLEAAASDWWEIKQ